MIKHYKSKKTVLEVILVASIYAFVLSVGFGWTFWPICVVDYVVVLMWFHTAQRLEKLNSIVESNLNE